MSDDLQRLFSEQRWDEIASQIDTGTENFDNSRALIVFNSTDKPVSGIACFHVDMPWRRDKILPAIDIYHFLTNQATRCRYSLTPGFMPADRRLVFDLSFEVKDIPALGWDTYIAEYVEKVKTPRLNAEDWIDSLIVAETLRHPGEYPPRWP